jgi:uncharacterized membrane protein
MAGTSSTLFWFLLSNFLPRAGSIIVLSLLLNARHKIVFLCVVSEFAIVTSPKNDLSGD